MSEKYKVKQITNRKIENDVEKTKILLKKYEFYTKYLENILYKNEPGSEKYEKIYNLKFDLDMKRENLINEKLNLSALRRSYEWAEDKDDRIFDVAEVMDEVFEFFEKNTKLTKDEVNNIVEKNLMEVAIYDEFKDNPYGIGFFDMAFGELAIKAKEIKGDLKYLLRHEFTHLLGTKIHKNVKISGYSKEPVHYSENGTELSMVSSNTFLNSLKKLFSKNKIEEKQNEQFNEALVDMFASKDKEFKEYNMNSLIGIDMNIYSNLNRGSCYIFNSNLVRQMIIARGVEEEKVFEGLFDEKCSKKVIKNFKPKIFKKISKSMDNINQYLTDYMNISDDLYEKHYEENDMEFDYRERCSKEELEKENKEKNKFMNEISKTERTIIDEILLPRIRKIGDKEKTKVLQDYSKFIINERDYFSKMTGFEFITKDTKKEENKFLENLKIENTSKLYEIDESQKIGLEEDKDKQEITKSI
ncbi:MAG: hypothetical protein IJH39_02890 [Clostridia bacterium]|nr:hypothetical protein [Clostridia bacterium]